MEKLTLEQSLRGAEADDEVGSVGEGGWYGIARFRTASEAMDFANLLAAELGRELSGPDLAALMASVGVIWSEDDFGFVTYGLFDSRNEMETEWERIVKKTEDAGQE